MVHRWKRLALAVLVSSLAACASDGYGTRYVVGHGYRSSDHGSSLGYGTWHQYPGFLYQHIPPRSFHGRDDYDANRYDRPRGRIYERYRSRGYRPQYYRHGRMHLRGPRHGR